MKPQNELNQKNSKNKVYKGLWHGLEVVYKCIFYDFGTDEIFEALRPEYFEQLKASNKSGDMNILPPLAYLKGQMLSTQEGQSKNMTIVVYPYCDYDLRKLSKSNARHYLYQPDRLWELIDNVLRNFAK